MLDAEFVLEAGAAAALDAHAQHGARGLAFEDFTDTARGARTYRNVSHGLLPGAAIARAPAR
jgi:hypothetical protein